MRRFIPIFCASLTFSFFGLRAVLPFGGGNQFLSQRSSAEGLADGADAHILSKKAGLRALYVVGERVDGAPGLFRQASGGAMVGA